MTFADRCTARAVRLQKRADEITQLIADDVVEFMSYDVSFEDATNAVDKLSITSWRRLEIAWLRVRAAFFQAMAEGASA